LNIGELWLIRLEDYLLRTFSHPRNIDVCSSC
jgi:hypothetical protein